MATAVAAAGYQRWQGKDVGGGFELDAGQTSAGRQLLHFATTESNRSTSWDCLSLLAKYQQCVSAGGSFRNN